MQADQWIAIHFPEQDARCIGIYLSNKLPTFALPLQSEILPIALDDIYRKAYSTLSISEQIRMKGDAYSEDFLPFPSTLSDEDRNTLLEQVEAWKRALKEAEG